MIKVYRYNADRNSASHIIQGKNGVTVRYNFERGNVVTKRKPEVVLKNKYAQDLLENSELFKGGMITLVRSERTPEDDLLEQLESKANEPTPTEPDPKVIGEVTNDSELLAFVNETDGRNERTSFRTPINALKWASENGYSFPNYNPE